tara:strand:+ start:4398 stop:4655 length:258 start_codon:yes stop_codon:yes gene_type:complete
MQPTISSKLVTLSDIEAQVQKNLPSIQPGKNYTLEELVGKKFWQAIPQSHRKELGHEYRAKERTGQLPVFCTGKTSCNKRLYQKR